MTPLLWILLTGLLFLSIHTAARAQAARKNPVVYAGFALGGAWGESGGLAATPGVQFQKGHHLFTARYTTNTKIRTAILHPFLPLPFPEAVSKLDEVGLLYGWRAVRGGLGYSFSAGLSYNTFLEYARNTGVQQVELTTHYAGVPFEANIQWFKARRERFRIYGLIPIGRPVGFGASIGLKVFGSVSKNSYVGFGLMYGLGWHREY